MICVCICTCIHTHTCAHTSFLLRSFRCPKPLFISKAEAAANIWLFLLFWCSVIFEPTSCVCSFQTKGCKSNVLEIYGLLLQVAYIGDFWWAEVQYWSPHLKPSTQKTWFRSQRTSEDTSWFFSLVFFWIPALPQSRFRTLVVLQPCNHMFHTIKNLMAIVSLNYFFSLLLKNLSQHSHFCKGP